MALANYPLAAGWAASARFTAASDVDVLIINPPNSFGHRVYWVITTDDTIPTETPKVCGVVGAGDQWPVQLTSGERLWLAGVPDFTGSVMS